jgi:hypothetical protein
MGDVDADRMKRALKKLRPSEEDLPDTDPADLERDLREAMAIRPEVRNLDIGVRALGEGLVELTGIAPDETTRTIAGKVAERVPGADVVVNRILVEGIDTTDQPTASISRAP